MKKYHIVYKTTNMKHKIFSPVLYAQQGEVVNKNTSSFEEINNNPLVQAAKIFDPTGVSSYPDVYFAGRDLYNDPSWRNAFNFGVNTLSALPIIGKAAVPLKLAKGTSKMIKAGNKTAETLSKIESYPVDWVIKNFEGMGSVIPSTVRKGAIGLNDLKSYLGNATTEQLNKVLGNSTGRGFSNKKITKEEKINLIIDGLNSVNTSSDIINTGQSAVKDIRAQQGGIINNEYYNTKNYNNNMKTKKSISSIFKQGGNAKMDKVLSSQAFMPAESFYANMYQLGGLAALPFGGRLPKAQNGVLASAMNPDPNAMPANWPGVPFDPRFAPSAQAAPVGGSTVADAYRNMLAAAGTDDTGISTSPGFAPSAAALAAASPVSGPPQLNLPPTGPVGGVPYWNMPTDPNQVVAATPDLVGVNPITKTAAAPAPAASAGPNFTPGVTPEGFVQVAQKEGETRWQYRYDPKNDIWQAFDTRRPEKGWMIPDAGKKQGQKADKAIRDRYQKDANSVVSEVFVKPAIPAYQSAVAAQGVDDSRPTAAQIAALPTVTQTAPQSITSRYDLGPSAVQPVESSITNAVETAPGSGTFTDSTGVTFSRMPAEEAAKIRAITPRVERPLNLKPQMNEGPKPSTPPPAREFAPISKSVGKYNINSNPNGDITISDGKNTFRVPEELGLYVEDLPNLSDAELKSLLEDFEDIISDREQRDFFNVTNAGRNERPGTVATNRRQPARRYTANRMNGGYGTSYFRDIANTFMDGGYPETMQSGGIPSMMGSALSNPAMSNRILQTMSANDMNSQSMFNPNTTTIPTKNMMNGGMPMVEVQTMSRSVRKMDPIKDFIKSPYTISSPEYDTYSKGDSYPGVAMTETYTDQMYGLPKVLKRIKR